MNSRGDRDPTVKLDSTILLAVLGLSFLTGCGVFPDTTKAREVGERYFEAMRRGDESSLMLLYSPRFFEATPREKWERMRASFQENLGEYQSHKLVNWSATRNVAGSTDSGDYTVLMYEVNYSKHLAQETITVHAPLGGGEALIVGHDVRWDLPVD